MSIKRAFVFAALLIATPAWAQSTEGAAVPAQGTATTPAGKTVITGNAGTTNDIAAAGGFRVSRIVGSPVYNDHDDSVGTVNDLIVSNGKPTLAILSVGGFLGVGDRLVEVPFARLRFHDNRVVLPAATRGRLKSMTEFHYVKNS